MDITSRKFWLTVGMILITTALLILKYIGETTWQITCLGVVGGYFAVNQIEAARDNAKTENPA
jgi:4-hydroxybenzoate polyprenyltransferase